MHAKQKILSIFMHENDQIWQELLSWQTKESDATKHHKTYHIHVDFVFFFCNQFAIRKKKWFYAYMMHHIKKKDVQLDGGHKDIYGIELLFFAIALNCWLNLKYSWKKTRERERGHWQYASRTSVCVHGKGNM